MFAHVFVVTVMKLLLGALGRL